MKWLVLLIVFSLPLRAQDICDPKVTPANCQEAIGKAVFHQDVGAIKKLINIHGIKILFEAQGVRGPYGHVDKADFFNFIPFFKMMAAHPNYPADIPDRGIFLKKILSDLSFREKDPELINLLFFNSDKNKRLAWWENLSWPYPLLSKFKQQVLTMKDKAKYAGLLSELDAIDAIKKDICQIKNLPQLEQLILKYPGIQVIFKNEEYDLLACSVHSKNVELSTYLLKNDFFPPQSLSTLVTKLELGGDNKINNENISLVSLFEAKRSEYKISSADKISKQDVWVLRHLNDDLTCFLEGNSSSLSQLIASKKLIETIIFTTFLNEVAELKSAMAQNDHNKKNEKIKNIIELVIESELPLNYQDSSGKSMMHYLAEFADAETIEKLENSLNSSMVAMNYGLQDNDGNTPIHIALMNKNLKAAMTFADNTTLMKNGFFIEAKSHIKIKNHKGKIALDMIKDIFIEKKNKELKTLKKNLTLIFSGKSIPAAYDPDFYY